MSTSISVPVQITRLAAMAGPAIRPQAVTAA
jgi:hypothetical protein